MTEDHTAVTDQSGRHRVHRQATATEDAAAFGTGLLLLLLALLLASATGSMWAWAVTAVGFTLMAWPLPGRLGGGPPR